jgi:hypothetical protein
VVAGFIGLGAGILLFGLVAVAVIVFIAPSAGAAGGCGGG